MLKYQTWVMLLIISAVVLSGCGNSRDIVSLIQAPVLSNEKQDKIKEALVTLLPSGVEYITPKMSEPKQAIFIDDINNDGKEEAYTLYRDIKENQQVHLLVLQEDNGSWNKLYDVATNFNTLDYFKLEDLDGNGYKEVIAGASISDSESKKQLLIYELDVKGLVKKVDHTYEGVDIADYDGDEKPDIFILDGERNKLQTAEMFSYEKGKLQSRALVELNTDAFHENIVSGKLADGKRALFIDSGLGAHSMLTEIVAYDNGKLIKVGDEKDDILLKAYPLYSKDINRDGVIEVGGMYIPEGFEDAAMAEIPFIYTYNDYRKDGTKQTIEQRYTDSGQHFYITIPSKWYGKVTIEKLDKGVKLVANEDQKALFEVKWINKESYASPNTKLGETKDTVFYTDTKEELSISNDKFHLLEDEF